MSGPCWSGRQLDALREVGNIGAGHAATVLSRLLGTRVEMTVPSAQVVPFDQVSAVLGGPETPIIGICLAVRGDISASILYALSVEEAFQLASGLLGRPLSGEQGLGELGRSTLEEVCNILSGAVLGALSDLTRLNLKPTVPALAWDMAGAIVDAVLSPVGQESDLAIYVETEFRTGGGGFHSQFFLVPDAESVEIILRRLGVVE